MVLIDYFGIQKALITLFLLFVCMNYVPSQNEKVLEEALAGFNSDSAKTTLRLLQVLEKSLSISQSFCHIKKRVLWMVL